MLRSEHLVKDEKELRACIRDECQKRLYLDAANQVITDCRGELTTNWISHFEKVASCPSREAALAALRERPEFAAKRESFAACSAPDVLARRFLDLLEEWTGGRDPLEFGHGRWLERIRGKEVMPAVVSRCFRVANAAGQILQGRPRELQLARELLQRPLAQQPPDLQELRRVIRTRVRGAAHEPSGD